MKKYGTAIPVGTIIFTTLVVPKHIAIGDDDDDEFDLFGRNYCRSTRFGRYNSRHEI